LINPEILCDRRCCETSENVQGLSLHCALPALHLSIRKGTQEDVEKILDDSGHAAVGAIGLGGVQRE
jgi:hypothetical protein